MALTWFVFLDCSVCLGVGFMGFMARTGFGAFEFIRIGLGVQGFWVCFKLSREL